MLDLFKIKLAKNAVKQKIYYEKIMMLRRWIEWMARLCFMLTIQTIKQPFTLQFAENLLVEGVTKHWMGIGVP